MKIRKVVEKLFNLAVPPKIPSNSIPKIISYFWKKRTWRYSKPYAFRWAVSFLCEYTTFWSAMKRRSSMLCIQLCFLLCWEQNFCSAISSPSALLCDNRLLSYEQSFGSFLRAELLLWADLQLNYTLTLCSAMGKPLLFCQSNEKTLSFYKTFLLVFMRGLSGPQREDILAITRLAYGPLREIPRRLPRDGVLVTSGKAF